MNWRLALILGAEAMRGHQFTTARTLGRLLQVVKWVRIRLAVSLAPQPQPQGICRPGGRPRLAFEDRPTGSERAGRFGQRVK